MDDGNDKVCQDVVGVLLGHGIHELQWSHSTKMQEQKQEKVQEQEQEQIQEQEQEQDQEEEQERE